MLENLFSSYTIKGKTIKNRCVVPAMVSNYCDSDGMATEKYIAYHEEKAKGGWGLIITEDYAVDPNGKGYVGVAGLWKDEQIPGHSELPRRVHAHGAKIFAQIYHCGRQTNSKITGSQPVAPSAIPCPLNMEMPRELTIDEIQKIIGQFGDTAFRAKKCGFDGVEIHGGHGYLIAQFMSPYSNKRADEYGGNLYNRMRFPLEIIQDIRRKCGEDFIIGFRISADEHVAGGRTIEDTKAQAVILQDAGIDILHVSAGVYQSGYTIIPMYNTPHGWNTDAAKEVKSVVDIPVITVGRINDPNLADAILKSGKADFVSMGRASLVDPHMPEKARNHQFEDIRNCIGCNQGCSGLLNLQQPIGCALNPELGHESEPEIKKAKTCKNIAVAGAGPAGLEAALTLAKAGHQVTVYEQNSSAGGQFRLAAIPPRKGEIINYINWQRTQCQKLGVEIKYNTRATADILKKQAYDLVVLGTGAKAVIPPIPGIENKNVVLAGDVLDGKVPVGSRVVIIGGGQVGVETALHIIHPARKISIVEMKEQILETDPMEQMIVMPELMQAQVSILTGTTVEKIGADHVEIRHGQNARLEADTVILAIGSKPENSLEKELKDAGIKVSVIGDAKEVANVLAANKSGYELGRAMAAILAE